MDPHRVVPTCCTSGRSSRSASTSKTDGYSTSAYPEMNMVGVTWILIGILAPGDTDPDPIPDYTDKVPLSWITKVEPWPPAVHGRRASKLLNRFLCA